jgi:protein-tyrosine-phosphatase
MMRSRPFNVLVLCTGNSARSILAEALLQKLGEGRIAAYSAGSQPKGEPNPFALQLLTERGYETKNFRSKSWNEFAGADAPEMHLVVTVCDSAAGESCPLWPGAPLKAHWGIEDPATETGSDDAKRAAFKEAYRLLEMRVAAFVALPFEKMTDEDLQKELRRIGAMEGASAGAGA